MNEQQMLELTKDRANVFYMNAFHQISSGKRIIWNWAVFIAYPSTVVSDVISILDLFVLLFLSLGGANHLYYNFCLKKSKKLMKALH